jgi:hypothetical protein
MAAQRGVELLHASMTPPALLLRIKGVVSADAMQVVLAKIAGNVFRSRTIMLQSRLSNAHAMTSPLNCHQLPQSSALMRALAQLDMVAKACHLHQSAWVQAIASRGRLQKSYRHVGATS